MASLTGSQKLFVVQRLACYHSLTEVCEQLLEEFGITAETNQIARYKVGCAAAESLSPDLVAAFSTARQEFLTDEQSVPIMHKSYRARQLQWMFERAKSSAPLVAAKMLEQAAKESGGHYSRPQDSVTTESDDNLPEEMMRQIDKVYATTTPDSADTAQL